MNDTVCVVGDDQSQMREMKEDLKESASIRVSTGGRQTRPYRRSQQQPGQRGDPSSSNGQSFQGPPVRPGDAKYACDQCQKYFDKQSSYTRHKYEHSGKTQKIL